MTTPVRKERLRMFTLVIVLIIVVGLVLWGKPIAFRMQVWLLERHQGVILSHWLEYGRWYLPYLVEETGNFQFIHMGVVLPNKFPDAWEAHAHIEVDTVNDACRLVLAELTGVSDGVGYSDISFAERQRAASFWKEWYRRNKDKLRWDSRTRIFVAEP